MDKERKYDATTIQVLSGIEAVRKRPAMYIGDTSVGGLHHLVYEVVDNSIDEAMAGFCTKIKVIVHSDNSVTIEDNGRGIPVDMHKTEKRPAVEVVMTVLHAGGKFDRKVYRVSGGLHGVGVSVVNALSEYLEVEVKREGKVYRQRYEKGQPITPLEVIGRTRTTGTKITFKPDSEIFETVEFDENILSGRLKELAFLNGGLEIIFEDERKGIRERYKFDGGLVSFVEFLNKNKKVLFEKPFYGKKSEEDIEFEFAFQFNDGYSETVLSFANNVNTKEGGTHLTGFKSGLTKAINEYGKSNGFLDKINLSGEDIREGLTAVISIKLPEPQFEGQTKTKLGNSKIRFIVDSITSSYVLTFLEENPEPARAILDKCITTAKAREAARKARDITRKKLAETGALPGKLADCSSKDPEVRELFIVEGDSAGGSAKQGRDRMFQAILPLKGKIINTEKASIDKVLNNDEVKMIISAIGAGVGDEFDISKARYKKIIIMTDADVDGSHIRTLLLTFFYRQMPELINQGYVYIAQPPLYKVKKGKKEFYVETEKEMEDILINLATENVDLKVKRNSKMYNLKDNIKEILILSKNISELIKGVENRGVKFANLIKYYEKNGKVPAYYLKDKNDKEYFFPDEAQLYDFLGEKGEEIDLFSEEKKDYTVIEIYEKSQLEKLLAKIKEVKVDISSIFNKVFVISNGSEGAYSLTEIFSVFKERGKKSLFIQRYKGLGEMNPSQLWETTMAPETRMLKRVTVEDAVKAEEIFTTLMGDAVEPRREFIEKFAREVKNLDI